MGISDDIIKQIQSALDRGIDPRQISKTAQKVADSVKKRTRLGKGVEKDGAKLSKLERLDPTYTKKRKILKKKGKLSSQTTPARSNLTKSGDMLDSIKTRSTINGFEIFIRGKANEIKAKFVQAKRPFMNLASFEIKLIVEDIIARVRRSR